MISIIYSLLFNQNILHTLCLGIWLPSEVENEKKEKVEC